MNDLPGTWIAFDDTDVNFIRGALKNDQFDRYYAAGGGQPPKAAEGADWATGAPIYDLGVPPPITAPTVIPAATGGVEETRAYVYTFVNEWGEESAPSPASDPTTGDIDDTWALSNMSSTYAGGLTPNTLEFMRIYRTVTGTNSVDYRFVAEIAPATGYDDNESIDAVSLNESLPSNGWTLPPTGLQGIVNMANGIMVGFVGRDLYFSEPYRPHTWPVSYQVSVDADIIGLGVYQSGVVVCTSSNPYVATGVHPASMALTRLHDVEPCQAFRSIVNGLYGVTYASQNGLILVNQAGARNLTEPLVTRNEWRQDFSPATSHSASDGSRVVTFTSISEGWLFQPMEPMGHIVDLQGFADVRAVQTDPFTGEAYIISRDVVFLWNPTNTSPQNYTWKSKVFEMPYPVNMGAYRLQYKDVITGIDYDVGFDYTNYNASRFNATTVNTESPVLATNPLNTLNLCPINGVRTETGVTESPPVTQFKMPLGGSPIYQNVISKLIRDNVRIRIWADDVLRYERSITSNQMMRLPSGYKADKWQIEFTTAQNIYSFKMAGTAKELAKA
jgi:hypothetical protein